MRPAKRYSLAAAAGDNVLSMRVLIAPDKFKGSLGAFEVAAAIAAGVRSAQPGVEIEIVALADGGEGTADAICRARHAEWVVCAAHDALGNPIEPAFVWVAAERLAIMEMSAAAGLAQLAPNERDPVRASTYGVGEMLRAAADHGAQKIIIGLGGSGTNDGGFGMACALGFHFRAGDGAEISGPVSGLIELAAINSPNDPFAPRLVAACDVRNPLLGPEGATSVFSAQKGADAGQRELLERCLTRLADVAAQTFARDHREHPGAGAAGGLGFGLLTFCNAVIRSGFEVVAEAVALEEKIARAEIVITGEGKLDRQTLAGKAPAGVAQMARRAGKRVFAIVGQASNDSEVRELFEQVITLDDTSVSYRDTPRLLESKAQALAESWSR